MLPKDGVSNWTPKMPTGKRENLLQPNAKDAPDTLNATNSLSQAMGKKGNPSGPFGKKGRSF